MRLAALGISHREIASRLQIQPQTVRKYLRMPEFVDRRHSPFPSHLEPYRAYLQQRWEQGVVMIKTLWQAHPAARLHGQLQQRLEISPYLAASSRDGLQRLVGFLCPSHSLDAGNTHSSTSHVAALA